MYLTEFHNKKFFKENFTTDALENTYFSECSFVKCTFLQTSWTNSKFAICSFNHCLLDQISLEGCVLQDTEFKNSKLTALNFFKCSTHFFSPHFFSSKLMGCNFSNLKWKRALFGECAVYDCFFSGASLEKGDFTQSDLKGSIFHQTNLSQADFRNAKNYHIPLESNTLTKAKFSLPEAMSLLTGMDIILE